MKVSRISVTEIQITLTVQATEENGSELGCLERSLQARASECKRMNNRRYCAPPPGYNEVLSDTHIVEELLQKIEASRPKLVKK